jgi:hypothetical protein
MILVIVLLEREEGVGGGGVAMVSRGGMSRVMGNFKLVFVG